jgi:hypothetical protein
MLKKAVVGILESHAHAETVIESLRANGFSVNDISVLFPDKRGSQDFVHQPATKAPEGAIAGVSTGGVIGGTIGLFAGIGALAVPGFGPLMAAGPLLAALSGAAAGATVGGLAGALVGLGMPEIEAKVFDGKLRGGNILLAVHVEDGEARRTAELILQRYGARDVGATSEASVPEVERRWR